MNELPILKKCILFANISTNDLSDVLACLCPRQKTYKKNETIILQGSHINHVYIVLSGAVNLEKHHPSGAVDLTSKISPSEIFGETFAICGEFSHVNAIAQSESTILAIPIDRIVHCCKGCKHHTQIIVNMLTMLSKKNITLSNKISIITKPTIREKVSAYLLAQMEQQKSNPFTIPISKTALCEYLYVNRSALVRQLSIMEQQGLLSYNGRTFKIINLQP